MIQKYFQKRQGSSWFKRSVAFGLTMPLNASVFNNCANAMEKVPSTIFGKESNCTNISEEEQIKGIYVTYSHKFNKPLQDFQNYKYFGSFFYLIKNFISSSGCKEDSLEKMDQSFLLELAKALRDPLFSQIFQGFYGGALRRKENLEKEFSSITKKALDGMCEKSEAIKEIKDELIYFRDKIVKAVKEICDRTLREGEMYLEIAKCVKERTDDKTFVEIVEKRTCFLTMFIGYFLRKTCLKHEKFEAFFFFFSDVAKKAEENILTIIKGDKLGEEELAKFMTQVNWRCRENIKYLITQAQTDYFSATYFRNILKFEEINDDQFGKIKGSALALLLSSKVI